jgi:hypothetical protein
MAVGGVRVDFKRSEVVHVNLEHISVYIVKLGAQPLIFWLNIAFRVHWGAIDIDVAV